MAERRHYVIDLKSGQHRRPMPGEPLVSSEQAPWSGFLLEEYADSPVEVAGVALPHHSLFLQLTPGELEIKVGSGNYHLRRREPGRIRVAPAMTAGSVRSRGRGSFVALTIEPSFVLGAIQELASPDHFEIVEREGLDDPLAREAILALRGEARASFRGGRLYAESIATALAVHLVRSHSVQKPALESAAGGLPVVRLCRVVEYIGEHLAEDLSLATLAAVAELSPFHFSRRFKQSTGLSPHQFLTRRRVERARELLLVPGATVADVATRVGFCDQSHLSSHFKRVYGAGPRAFVRRLK
jgi:AraC family transcriptional regulator